MKILKIFDKYFEEVCIFLCLLIISILVVFQVFMRYVMQDSLYWSEELVKYIFIFMVYIGISDAVKKGAHISIDAIHFFSEGKWTYLIPNFIFSLFSIFVSYHGFLLSMKLMMYQQTTPALQIPTWIIYSFVPFGYLLVVIRLIQVSFNVLLNKITNN